MKYRKKPVVIEARRLRLDNLDSVAEWCGGTVTRSPHNLMATGLAMGMAIPTLEGPMYAYPGDWIIRDVAGKFYSCNPVIFEATYEEVAP